MNITRTFDILPYALKNNPFEDCLAAKENGKWRKYSTQEFSDKVNQMSNALIEIGSTRR
jgi:long-chain acyl-CoA synthetase